MTQSTRDIDINGIDQSISMIKKYVEDDSVSPVITLLESLKANPENEATIVPEIKAVLATLGIVQGAVLTYAPYIISLISDDFYDSNQDVMRDDLF